MAKTVKRRVSVISPTPKNALETPAPVNASLDGKGKDCDTDIKECTKDLRNICGDNAKCHETPGSYYCICDVGYKKDRAGACVGMSQSACLRWPNVGSGSYGWLLVGVGFITQIQRCANVYYPRYQKMYRIRWLDLLDKRWANVCSPHYHRTLEYVGHHELDQHWANVYP